MAHPTAEPFKVVRICRDRLWRFRSFEKQAAQELAIPVLPDQFADILARRSVASCADLIVHEVLEVFGKRYVHCAHQVMLTRIDKVWQEPSSAEAPLWAMLTALSPGGRR